MGCPQWAALGAFTYDVSSEGEWGYPKSDHRKRGCMYWVLTKGEGVKNTKNYEHAPFPSDLLSHLLLSLGIRQPCSVTHHF